MPDDVVYVLEGVSERAAGAQPTVVPEADDVRPQLVVAVPLEMSGRRRSRRGRHSIIFDGDRDAEARHPDVGPVLEPVGILDEREAAGPPPIAPGVLNPKARFVERDDREGVSAEPLALERNDAAWVDVLPPLMHRRRREENSDCGQRAVHRDQIPVVHAKVRSERSAPRFARAALGQASRATQPRSPTCRPRRPRVCASPSWCRGRWSRRSLPPATRRSAWLAHRTFWDSRWSCRDQSRAGEAGS